MLWESNFVFLFILVFLLKFKEKIISYAFGDSMNDFEMLEAVDHGFLVKKFNNKYSSSKYKKADRIGPIGFNREVLKIIK